MQRMDLRGLDLNLLVALDRLLAHASVTAAARELHLSQPAASRTLARLRDVLGDPLLVKSGRGLVRTERARELAGPVAEALAAARRVFAPPERFDPATARGELVLALGDETQAAFGAAIAVAIWACAPGIDLRVSRLSEASVEAARRGQIDLALAPDLGPLPRSAGAVDLADLVVRPLYVRRMVVVSGHGRVVGPLDLDTFTAARHVIVSFEAGSRGFVDDLLERLGRARRVAASVTSFPAAVALVRDTDLLATVPEEVALAEPGVARHAPPLALPDLPVALMWHPRHTAEARHRFLRELVADAVLAKVRGTAPPPA